ncbi:MAG: GNAT family N-acetyltransferase [Paracoccaceae bacterium]|nr:GNAT family N-acetyltransferase [Paracoccaceae bacterium]
MEIAWDTLDEAAWAARLNRADAAPLQQSWGYGVAMAALGATVRRALILVQGQEVALAQVLERRGVRLIGRGPVWLGESGAGLRRAVLRALARRMGPTLATPGEAVAGFGLIPLITPRHHAFWDLTPQLADLRSGLSGKWRNRLLKAETAQGMRGLQTADASAVEALLTAETAQRRARGYRALPADFIRAWPDEVLAWNWHKGGQIRAGMVFLRHGPWASYHIAWADAVARADFVHGPMLWQAMLDLRARGVRGLDLGDVNHEDAPGLARFKLGTGARVTALGATCWVLPG